MPGKDDLALPFMQIDDQTLTGTAFTEARMPGRRLETGTAAADPPLEPPAVFDGSQGLLVGPHRGLSVTPFQPNSGVVVLPSGT